jgi:hypothetical protein
MHDLSDWNRFDAAAFRVSIRRSVRRYGWFLAVVGAIVAACGFAGDLAPMAVTGLLLACAGAWNIVRPSITGLIVDGIALLLAGAFNCLAWLWIEGARTTSVVRWIAAGVIQIVWGIRRLAIYRTARLSADDPDAIARLEAVVHELSKRNAKADPTIVEFWTGRFRRRRNRLGLYSEGAIALLEHQAVRLERRADIWIEARGTTWHGRSIKVRIQMGDLQWMGQMPAAHFDRFERWKLGLSQPRPIAA